MTLRQSNFIVIGTLFAVLLYIFWLAVTMGNISRAEFSPIIAKGGNIDVFVEDRITGNRTKCNEAIFTFVAIDQNGAPLPVPPLIPETEEEKKRYEGALRRRQLSLILGGRMKPDDATELKALFIQD